MAINQDRKPRRLHIHFVNENVQGHATMHLHLRQALVEHADVVATFFDVPQRSLVRRIVAAPVPGLRRLDLDLQPLRDQLAKSFTVRRHLDRVDGTPDALHLYTHNASLVSVGAMRRVPSIVSLDATNRQNAYNHPLRPPTRFTRYSLTPAVGLERRVYEAARRVVTHSRWAADSVLSYGVPAHRVEVIPFGIGIPPVRAPLSRADMPRIVFVGSSMSRKGGWKLVELWRRFLRDRSRLVIVTPEKVPAEPGLEVRNDIRQGDGQIGELLASADVFAMPSEIDQFGYAPIEAMAAGLPVVAFRVAAMPEIIDDGTTGTLVAPGDHAAFVRALDDLVSDQSARQSLGAAGRARAEQRFDARVTTAALVDLLRDVAGR